MDLGLKTLPQALELTECGPLELALIQVFTHIHAPVLTESPSNEVHLIGPGVSTCLSKAQCRTRTQVLQRALYTPKQLESLRAGDGGSSRDDNSSVMSAIAPWNDIKTGACRCRCPCLLPPLNVHCSLTSLATCRQPDLLVLTA